MAPRLNRRTRRNIIGGQKEAKLNQVLPLLADTVARGRLASFPRFLLISEVLLLGLLLLLLLQIVLPPLKYPLLFNIHPPLKQIPPFFQLEKLPAVPCQLLQPPALLIAIQLPVTPFSLLNLIFPLFLANVSLL